ncbi:MAG: hypothetical protein HOE11_02610 [Candidatus Diapherotrites archaeon]|jgi:ribosomal protein S24E|nr:hypothetical protein [Candidatus Diapherotrites archaeon]MBT4597069.1 hypothetical protein [Candidatus Diapherotrites archaeon]
MKLKITQNTRNEALKRSNIVAIDEEKIIPSRVEMRENLSAQLNIPKEQIVVRKIDTSFGTTTKTIYAMAYDDEETMKKTEEKYVITRNFGKAKEGEATEAPAESAPKDAAPKEEAIAEPAKEETKVEEAKPEEKTEEPVAEKKEETAAEEKAEEPKKEEKKE